MIMMRQTYRGTKKPYTTYVRFTQRMIHKGKTYAHSAVAQVRTIVQEQAMQVVYSTGKARCLYCLR